jgi:hypothetical protein
MKGANNLTVFNCSFKLDGYFLVRIGPDGYALCLEWVRGRRVIEIILMTQTYVLCAQLEEHPSRKKVTIPIHSKPLAFYQSFTE